MIRIRKIIFIFILPLLFTCFPDTVKAQNTFGDSALVQFSGLVVTADSNVPIPYANIKVRGTYRGTVANYDGFFSLVIRKSEIIEVSAMGFKGKNIKLPDNLDKNNYVSILELQVDTLVFKETEIYPWPTPEEFKRAFVELEIADDFIAIAEKNLDRLFMKRLLENMGMDGRENQRLFQQQMAIQGSYAGGQMNYAVFPGSNVPIPLSLLDPFAWAKFFDALKEGLFRRKDKD